LVLDSLNSRSDSIDITQVLSTERSNRTIISRSGDHIQIVIKLVNERSAGGNVELGNLILGNVVKVLHKGTERVAVSSDNDVLSGLEVGNDLVLPVGKDTVQGGGKRLGKVIGEGVVGITGIVGWVVLAGTVDSRRRDVVRATPDEDLVLSVLVDSLLLVKALKRSIVTFVELPGLVHGNPHEVSLLEDVPKSTDGTLQQRSVSNSGLVSSSLNELSGLNDLLVALGAEGNIDPTSELVLKVPSRLAVPDKNESALVGSLSGGKAPGRNPASDERSVAKGEHGIR